MLNKLGIYYTCHKEKEAMEYSIATLRKVYPQIPIYLVSDGGLDYKYLETQYDNLQTQVEIDTLFFNKDITDVNYISEYYQALIKMSVLETIRRLNEAIIYCQSEYILMMDPDAIVRGPLSIPNGVKLLGCRINTHFPQKYKEVLSRIPGAKVIHCWGATPGIFHVETYQKAVKIFLSDPKILDDFCKSFYAMYAHDVLLPTLFALVGEEEQFNPELVQCTHDPNWESSGKPLLHQFRKYYPCKV